MDSHPFWDFLNEAYNNGPGGQSTHPRGPGNHRQNNDFQNWQDVFGNGFPFGPMPHRGRPGPPPPPAGAPHHPPPPHGPADPPHPPRPSTPPTPPEELPQYPGDEPPHPPPRSHSHSPPPHHHGPPGDERPRHGRHARHQRREERRDERREDREDRREEREERREERRERRGRHWDSFEGGFGGPPPFFGGRGRHCRGRGGRGGRGGANIPIQDFVNQLPYYAAQIPYYANQIPGLVNHLFPANAGEAGNASGQAAAMAAARDFDAAGLDLPRGDGSFAIDVDVFSTVEAYVIHAAVPGAKKSDIDVSYDAAKNSVLISGVIQRPAEVDEIMLGAMIEGEREVGLFERKVYLDDNAKVDAEGLRAKLEDGVLRIELPKLREDDWTDVKKVAVE